MQILHALNHHLSHLISTIGIEMGVVCQWLFLIAERVGGVMHQCTFASLHTQGLEEGLRHTVEIDDLHMLTLCYGAHGSREITMSVGNLSFFVEVTALGRCAEDDCCSLASHLVNEDFEVSAIVIPCS